MAELPITARESISATEFLVMISLILISEKLTLMQRLGFNLLKF